MSRPPLIWTNALATSLLLVAFVPQVDARQDADDDAPPETREQEATEEAAARQDEEQASEPVVAPAQALGYSGPVVLREAAGLVSAAGRLAQHERGYWTFTIEQSNPSRDSASLIVLPSRTLERMERAIAAPDEGAMFEVTGSIHLFEGGSFLLPLAAHQRIGSEPVAPPQPAPAPDAAPEPPLEIDTSELSADEIIARVERDVPITQSLIVDDDEDAGDVAIQFDDDATGMDDGGLLLSRRGRVTRTSQGGWSFSFSADASGRGDPPMTLLPCELLESIQSRIEAAGGNAVFILTGRVFRYRGRDFLLPTMFRVEDAERNPNIRG